MHSKLKLLILCALSVSALDVLAATKVVDGSTEAESGATYQATASEAALWVTNQGAYSGTAIILTASNGYTSGRGGYGAYVDGTARLDLHSSTVTLITSDWDRTHYKYAVFATGQATVSLTDVQISATATRMENITYALSLSGSAIGQVQNVTVNFTKTQDFFAGAAVQLTGDATLTGTGLTIYTSGVLNAHGIWVDKATYDLTDVTITTAGTMSYGLYANAGSSGTVRNLNVKSEASALLMEEDNAFVTVIGGTLQGLIAVMANSYHSGTNQRAVLVDVDLIGSSAGIMMSAVTAAVEMNGGSISVTDPGGSKISVNGGTDHQIILNDVRATDDGSKAVSVSGSASVNVTANNTDLYGDVIGSGSGTLDLTVSGTNSTLLGDITQNDDAAVTITLDNSATGQGGYNGGNLITSSDSVWTFDKNSHGNYGENHGVWNIGDYNVTFDNMTHTGTVNLSVNTDTGDGGSITVTGTADGEGTVHIDTAGNGQLNPNDVLPGIVSGPGTEHWQWDPIDWGLDTIIKDGDHFTKHGTSPAGAVLNSAIAVQQSMWFAQQNSLLKRLGELRYGTRASLSASGRDARAPYNLIENIWLRSYGQQLNVGSQVAGKAYEQLIYGVDLGTDHKFTISADSDLYLGIYAGYGRSDIDYRTPGADGEINSYYGGLYATWLHSSGFYIDATFKAASVDNDLKAPYGNTQLTASYSDVNIGGSIEIGNKFTFTDGWFVEPQFQVNYLHILAEDYTAGPMSLKAQDLNALQLRIGSLFGRSIKLTNGGALQPYVKVSGVETISSGGAIRNGYQHTRANTDGARAELGAGLIWQLDTNNQLHLDYEASFGDKYDKPWGLTAGYRHQF
ncbi:MAG: autotransporter outer membrane beta-barrel domain-containing protein [Verrucomicrobiales bacterium]|jgi:outer membrane autotransporter protein|nr:autotransporter outer membrane beta-barrel domain-containing protein [Verrucomicrobiales bacterium]